MTIVSVESDSDGNLIIPFDTEILEEMGWGIGDTIQWIDNNDGTYSLIKYEDSDS